MSTKSPLLALLGTVVFPPVFVVEIRQSWLKLKASTAPLI
jgi:hypothetical protein